MQINVIIITGAASGIGKATATTFEEKGWIVCKLDIISLSEKENHSKSIEVGVDVTDPADLTEAFEKIFFKISKLGSIGYLCLFSCAGRALSKEFETTVHLSDEAWAKSIDLNLNSHYYVFSRFKILMQRISHTQSSILFMSSINAIRSAGLIGYSSAKAGLIGLTKALSTPMGHEFGTPINCLLAGTVEPSQSEKIEPKNYEILADRSALKKNAQELDIAVSVYAIMTEMTHMTGQSIVLDGGQSTYFTDFSSI